MEGFEMKNLIVSETPHIRSRKKTSNVMLKVVFALLPAAIWGIYIFGLRALFVMATAIVSCLLAETLYNLIAKKENTIKDGSALVTGLLLGMNISSLVPYYQVVLASFFAIIVVKMLFGGLGCNFMNPALAGRAFLMASFAGDMAKFEKVGADALTSATPLVAKNVPLLDLFIGKCSGSIGEVSALLLILGGMYLVLSGVIKINIPLAYIGTVAVLEFTLGGFNVETMLYALLSGGLMLGAFFMATDYVTSPVTGKGMVAAGILAGVLTYVIRHFGGYPEGVSYAILLMNVATPLIDKVFKNKRFGEVAKWKKQKA